MAKTGKEAPATKAGFSDCFIDESPTVVKIELAGMTFRMRALTAGEMRDCHAEAKVGVDGKYVGGNTPTDLIEVQIRTIACAMGVKKKYADEGWSVTRDLTLDNVRMLNEAIIVDLYLRHAEFFRLDIVDARKSKSDD